MSAISVIGRATAGSTVTTVLMALPGPPILADASIHLGIGSVDSVCVVVH